MIWYKNNNSDIVVSTRIRLARNLDSTPFPNALKDTKEVTEKIKSAILGGNSTLARDFDFIDLDNTPDIRKQSLAEEHLISPVMLKGKGKSVLISKDKTMSIMLMEEDHIRLQIIQTGYALDEAFSTASKVDDVIEENITYAFDNDFGYLTACPTNTGTGMRASVMMHLPALTMTENINRVISSAGSLGIEVRGLYGEGTKAYGNLYQISNRITLGLSEEQVLEKLKNIVNQIIETETKARKALTDNSADPLSDRLFRSYGTLKYARSMSSSEAKSLLSDVMLGQNLGIIPKDGKISPLECMVITEPALLSNGEDLSPAMRDKKRAELIRNNI
ncbi:MAG: protein arginine kinase [Oscillospiraceae bacterium]|nr:protein arginine kinase [Oscillospiraceae bacterium]